MLFGIIAALVIAPAVIVTALALLRKANYPEKTFFNCFLNVALTPMKMFNLGPYKFGKLDLEKAMKYAVKKTGLTDFGDLAFVEGYHNVFKLETQKKLKLTSIGYLMHQVELNQIMYRRLTFLQYLKDMPQVLNVPVRTPVFVFGLPRTGTTFLHRLLSLDPAVRSPLLWELLSPVPKERCESKAELFEADRNKRAKAMRKLIAQRQSLGDNALQHIHEIDADLPEECIFGLTDEIPAILSFFYSAYTNYEVFLGENSGKRVISAYAYYKKILQLLSYQVGEEKNARRWVLKCPIHMFYIKEIAAVFPDAKMIWTHRHPVSAIPSLCSLVKSLHQVYYENETRDDKLLGRQICNLSAKYLEQAPKDLEESQLEYTNINYENLVKDPVGTVKQLYRQYKWDFTPQYEEILNAYLKEDRLKRDSKMKEKQRDVLHTYTPEEFSLTAEELSQGKFADYAKKYNVPMSKN